jgi:hypothetical protein
MKVVKEFESTDMTQAEFARDRKLSHQALQYWISTLRRERARAQPPGADGASPIDTALTDASDAVDETATRLGMSSARTSFRPSPLYRSPLAMPATRGALGQDVAEQHGSDIGSAEDAEDVDESRRQSERAYSTRRRGTREAGHSELGVELVLRNGARLRFPGGTDVTYIRSVLAALRDY